MTHILQASAAARPDIQPAPYSLRQDLIPVTQQEFPSNAGSIRPGRWIYSQPLFSKALQNRSIYSTCYTCESLLNGPIQNQFLPWQAGTVRYIGRPQALLWDMSAIQSDCSGHSLDAVFHKVHGGPQDMHHCCRLDDDSHAVLLHHLIELTFAICTRGLSQDFCRHKLQVTLVGKSSYQND